MAFKGCGLVKCYEFETEVNMANLCKRALC